LSILHFLISTNKGHYATGKALEDVGVTSSNDMTLEAISCKIAYLMGRGDLNRDEIAKLMTVSVRGEGELHFTSLSIYFIIYLTAHLLVVIYLLYTYYNTVTHNDALPPPPFSTAYQRASKKGRYYY